MEYRADIDGLRALAVVPVLLFHAHVSWFSGGYVGVDIFFVISGYLLTSIIRSDIERGRYSIATFYQRRVLRIFPALFAVLIASSIAATVILMPFAYRDFGQSVAATTTFSSNILFWRESGYFDGPAELKPLLHTWSLAVEEQFYIVLPLLMMAIHRWARRLLTPVLLTIAALSFAMSVWGVRTDPSATFYLAHFRAWELLIGSVLAANALPRISRPWLRTAASAAGLLLIVASVVVYDDTTPFPGLAALVPCAGAALIIHCGLHERTAIHDWLSWRPIVGIGKISYSLYLWHWPIIVFTTILARELGLLEQAFMVVASFGAGFLSWKYVEQPFRTEKARHQTARTFRWAALAIAAALPVGLLAHFTKGLPSRFGITTSDIERFDGYGQVARSATKEHACFTLGTGEPSRADFEKSCIEKHKKNILLLGDSHAGHVLAALAGEFPDTHFALVSAGGCRPLKGKNTRPNKPSCAVVNRFVFETLIERVHVDGIILSATWEADDRAFLAATLPYFKRWSGNVTVFGPSVRYDENLPFLLLTHADAVDSHRRPEAIIDREIRAVSEAAGAHYVSLLDTLCRPSGCTTSVGDVPLLWDDEHFTVQGASWIVHTLAKSGALAPP